MKIFARLIYLCRKFWPFWLIGFILLVLSSFFIEYGPIVLKNIFDDLTRQIQTSDFNSFNFTNIRANFFWYILIIVIGTGLNMLGQFCLVYSAAKSAEYLRFLAFKHMQALPVAYFEDKPATKISTTIVNYTNTLQNNFYLNIFRSLSSTIIPILVIYFYCFRLNVYLGLIMLLIIPLFFLWQYFYIKMSAKPNKIIYDVVSDINNQVSEIMNNSMTVQLYKEEENFAGRFNTLLQKRENAMSKLIFTQGVLGWNLNDLIQNSFTIIFLSIASFSFLGGGRIITSGFIFVLISYLKNLFSKLGILIRSMPDLVSSLDTGKRVIAFLDTEVETDSKAKFKLKKAEVEFKNVSFSYVEGTDVLKNINFKVQEGQKVAFVGHTGSGKSSIMNLLFRFYDPQDGQILIGGQDIKAFERESIRQDMGIVLQDPFLYTGTIASNVSMGKDDICEEEILAYLEKIGAKSLISRLPEGINTRVSEKGKGFSSGERQLICFARTLASNPKILVLDEATSHIDTETENLIQNAIKIINEGRTCLIIAHRLSTIKDADMIYVMEKGQIVEQGTHDTLLEQQGYYAEMYNNQQS